MGPRKRGLYRSKKEIQRDSSKAKRTRSLKNKVRDAQRLLKKVRHFLNSTTSAVYMFGTCIRVRSSFVSLLIISKLNINWLSGFTNFSFSFFKFFNRLCACHSVSSFSYICQVDLIEDLQFSVVNCQSRYKFSKLPLLAIANVKLQWVLFVLRFILPQVPQTTC